MMLAAAGPRLDADKFLGDLLSAWRLLDATALQFRILAEPIVEGVILWDADNIRIFPPDDHLAHTSVLPLLADMKRLNALRDDADPVATERIERNSTAYYWCTPDSCLAVNGPAMAEAIGLDPATYEEVFSDNTPSGASTFAWLVAVLISISALLWAFRGRGRKNTPQTDPESFQFGPVRINPTHMSAEIDGQTSDLTRRDLKIIAALYANRGAAISKDQLYDAGWGRDFMPNSRALEQHILTLRKKLDPDRRHPEVIETVFGHGYRFNK
ncbi:MAG: winged helix-turn-helix domain-containing protein [Sulfitobacter sp.]